MSLSMRAGDGHRNRRRHPYLVAGGLIAAGSLLAACSQGTPASDAVPLLPAAAAEGHAWNWEAGCQPGAAPSSACAVPHPTLGVAQLDGDEWNLGSSPGDQGSVAMSVDAAGAVAVKGNLSSAPPCTESGCLTSAANTWVRGYPNVLYGINQCHAPTSPPRSPKLRLPVQVQAIPSDLIGVTDYSAHGETVTYDVAYDMWLNRSDTRTPCITNGTLEVMVWTDYDTRALLPASMKVSTASVPFAVNGVTHAGKDAWGIYVSNVYGNGNTAPWGGTIWFVLDSSKVVKKGSVSVDLSSVLSSAGTLLEDDYGWKNVASTYWLDTVPFGMEYGPESGTPTGAGPSHFSLNISTYCLAVGATVSTASC